MKTPTSDGVRASKLPFQYIALMDEITGLDAASALASVGERHGRAGGVGGAWHTPHERGHIWAQKSKPHLPLFAQEQGRW